MITQAQNGTKNAETITPGAATAHSSSHHRFQLRGTSRLTPAILRTFIGTPFRSSVLGAERDDGLHAVPGGAQRVRAAPVDHEDDRLHRAALLRHRPRRRLHL